MTLGIVALVGVLFLALLLLRVPIAISLLGSSFIGIALVRNLDSAFAALRIAPYNAASNVSLVIVPLFILMGILAVRAGLADDAFDTARRVLRGLPGGPAIASLAGSGLFAAVTGSSLATVATMARVSTDAILRAGYSIKLAAGAVSAGGTLGVLIPPSIVLVLYGVVAEVSIGALLLAGVLPGLLSLAMYGLTAVLYGFFLDRKARKIPTDQREMLSEEATSAGNIAWGSLAQFALLFFAAIGTIYLGIATPTEAASLGALVATFLLVFRRYRKPKEMARTYGSSLFEAAGLTAMVFILLVGAGVFTYFLALTGATQAATGAIVDAQLPAWGVLLLALAILLPLGMFLDGISMILIMAPVLHPILTSYGFDEILVAILVVKVAEMALITPPVGLNAFVYAGVVEEASLGEVFRGLVPFVLADVVTVVLLIVFPVITLWLPSSAGLI